MKRQIPTWTFFLMGTALLIIPLVRLPFLRPGPGLYLLFLFPVVYYVLGIVFLIKRRKK